MNKSIMRSRAASLCKLVQLFWLGTLMARCNHRRGYRNSRREGFGLYHGFRSGLRGESGVVEQTRSAGPWR
jgi:hypothetical protein